MIKGSIQEEDITILNIYAPNIGAPQYIRQILTTMKGEINSNTIIVGDLTHHLHQSTDHPSRKYIRKQALNDTIRGERRGWQKSKTRRSPSSPQIHQKYIYTWNCPYRTPTERWQKTSDFPKGKKLPT